EDETIVCPKNICRFAQILVHELTYVDTKTLTNSKVSRQFGGKRRYTEMIRKYAMCLCLHFAGEAAGRGSGFDIRRKEVVSHGPRADGNFVSAFPLVHFARGAFTVVEWQRELRHAQN